MSGPVGEHHRVHEINGVENKTKSTPAQSSKVFCCTELGLIPGIIWPSDVAQMKKKIMDVLSEFQNANLASNAVREMIAKRILKEFGRD